MTKDELSKEDIEALNKDVERAASALTEQAVQKAKEEGRQEAVKELELKRQLEDQERKTKELEAKLSEAQKAAEGNLKQLQEKVDSMASSKQVIAQQNPFKEGQASPIDSWSEDKVKKFEEASARAFFGPSFDERL